MGRGGDTESDDKRTPQSFATVLAPTGQTPPNGK